MTITAAKEKLHSYIDHADEKMVLELLALFEHDKPKSGYVYDEETLNMLRETRAEYLSDKSASSTLKEFMEYIELHRKKNGI